MKDATYHRLVGLLDAFLWSGDLEGAQHLPGGGPAVFVCNHVGAMGPIATLTSLPLRVHPWVIGDMLDAACAPAYLQKDFVERQLHLGPPLSIWVSRTLARIAVPLLRAAGCIAVRQGAALFRTYQQSLDLLLAGQCLLVFPEDPHRLPDERCRMSPFQRGFARLGEIYFQAAGMQLAFHPLAVHVDSRRVRLGHAVRFSAANPPRRERERLTALLERMIREMYLSMAMEQYLGVPLPH